MEMQSSGHVDVLRDSSDLTRWRLSEPQVTPWPGTARPMPDLVDYRFVNGWVATGDLPCRAALRASLPQRDFLLSDCLPLTRVYAAGDSPRVDFSTFRPVPELIARWARTRISAAAGTEVKFELETCGSVHLWVGDRLHPTAVFEPCERNIPHQTRIRATLAAGETDVTLRFEDLHERDTSCFFRLTVVDGAGVAEAAEDVAVGDARRVLDSIRTDRLFYRGGAVHLVSDAEITSPVEVALLSRHNDCATMNVLAGAPEVEARVTLSAAGVPVPLIKVNRLAPGCVALPLQIVAGGITVEREIGTTVLPTPRRIDAPDLRVRKRQYLKCAAGAGGNTPSRAVALLAQGRAPQALPLIAAALHPVELRHDCADFFLLPLLRIWRDFRGELPPDLAARLRAAIIGFRYWTDEPGNDVMWFWSENHVLCFHVAQYVAGSLMPDSVFTSSGRRGAEQCALAEERLDRWFASVETHGFAEWNSAAYYPIDFAGLLTLFDMGTCADLRRRAARLCDLVFSMTALHTIGGVSAGSQGRAYERELFAGPATELAATAAVAFGGPFVPGFERAAALFAVSDYEPPGQLSQVARTRPGRALEARYVQGLDGSAKINLWRDDTVMLSSVADHRTGAAGHQQHVIDVMFARDPFARIWINHPGDLKPWGGSRPSLWAGSGVVPRVAQTAHTAFLIFDLGRQRHPIAFTHALVPAEALDEVAAGRGWVFARAGEGYCAIWCDRPLTCQEVGLYAGSEWRAYGRRCGWIVHVGSRGRYGSFDAFRRRAEALRPVFDAAALRLETSRHALEFDGPFFIDGAPVVFEPMSIWPHLIDDGAPRPLLDAV